MKLPSPSPMRLFGVFLALMFWLSLSPAVKASNSVAYCNYDQAKSAAERLLDQSPSIIAGFGRDNTGTNNTLAIGVTESLSKFLQGALSNRIGESDCRLYQITTEIQKHVTYDLQTLQLQQLHYQESLTQNAITQLDSMIIKEQRYLGAGTSTIPNIALLQAAKETLIVNLANLKQQSALIVLPKFDGADSLKLSDLLRLANVYTNDEQQELANQSKYQSWDLSITVGKGSNPNYPMLHSLPNQTFGTIQLTYSFGARERARELDDAANSYTQAMVSDPNGPINLAYMLRQQIIQAQIAAIKTEAPFKAYNQVINTQLHSIAQIQTSVARAFRIQLTIAQLNNNIQLQTNQYAQQILGRYLTTNFPLSTSENLQ